MTISNRSGKFPGMLLLGKALLVVLAVLLLFNPFGVASDLKEPEPKRVLVIYSYHEGLPWERLIDDSLRATLASKLAVPIELNIEHTDRVAYPDEAYLHKLIDLYRHKYSYPKMDLVISVDDEATEILLKHGEKLFPGIPILFVTAERKTLQRDFLKPNMTSLLWGVDIQGTVDLIQEILPETRHLYVISGSSLSDRAVQKMAREALRGYTKRLEINYLAEITAEDLIGEVTQLPEHSVLFYLAFSRDAAGKSFVPREMMSVISEKANVPIFGIVDTYLGHGIVGGRLLSAEVQGKRCAEVAVRILRGDLPVDIAPERTLSPYMFDWRQLKRWSISEDKLPPGSIVRHKEISIWKQYKLHIIGLIGFFVIQTLLIVILWIQWARRVQAEKQAFENEIKYRTVADFTYDWEYWAKFDGTLRYVSPSCERISGYTVQEFMDNSSLFRDIIIPEDKEVWDKHYRDSRQEMTLRNILFRIRRRDGRIRWLEHACQPVTDNQGSFLGFRASNRDITERKKAEAESQKHREELAYMARRATMGEITASLAHELNQPLTAILSSAQAAQRFLSGHPPDLDKVRGILNHIAKDDKRASEMIQRLRALLGKGDLQIESLDISELIRKTATLMKSYMVIENVSIVMELAADLPSVCGDKIQLEQVVLNLVLNGSETMTALDHDSRKLIISTGKHDEQMVKVSVRDSGNGLDHENMERIFEPFYTTKPEGMGMGLSISRSIIEAHGGRLWAENNPDRGATVSFTVPVFEHEDD